MRCFNDWITDRGGVGQADLETGIRQVRAFLETHGSSRFQSVVVRLDKEGQALEERIFNRAGYWKEEDDERVFLIFPETFQTEVCRGLDYKLIAKELAKRDLLIKGDGKNMAKKERVRNEGSIRVYAIRARILGDEPGN
jgi:putative DNA primase/helicase